MSLLLLTSLELSAMQALPTVPRQAWSKHTTRSSALAQAVGGVVGSSVASCCQGPLGLMAIPCQKQEKGEQVQQQ